MDRGCGNRLLREQPIESGPTAAAPGDVRRVPAGSVTVNLAESPLGGLYARGLVTRSQFDAGELLRFERGQLSPRVTMSWDAAPMTNARGEASAGLDLSASQIDARQRFDAAIAAAAPGLSDILWRIVCAGEGMLEAETALGWPARAGKLVLTIALDGSPLFTGSVSGGVSDDVAMRYEEPPLEPLRLSSSSAP